MQAGSECSGGLGRRAWSHKTFGIYRAWLEVTPIEELNVFTNFVDREKAPQQRRTAASPMASFQCIGRVLIVPRAFVAGKVMAVLLLENRTLLERAGDLIL